MTDGTEVAIDVDNQIGAQDQSHQISALNLENVDLDLLHVVDRISKNQVDWRLLNDDQFSRELDIFIDIFAQEDLQDDEV